MNVYRLTFLQVHTNFKDGTVIYSQTVEAFRWFPCTFKASPRLCTSLLSINRAKLSVITEEGVMFVIQCPLL